MRHYIPIITLARIFRKCKILQKNLLFLGGFTNKISINVFKTKEWKKYNKRDLKICYHGQLIYPSFASGLKMPLSICIVFPIIGSRHVRRIEKTFIGIESTNDQRWDEQENISTRMDSMRELLVWWQQTPKISILVYKN